MQVICGDIGGTNANLGLAECAQEVTISHTVREPTARYKDFSDLINKYLETLPCKPVTACFAAAGIVHDQRIHMTNANLILDAQEIIKKTPLKNVLIINDFEAIGYAINRLTATDIVTINAGLQEARQNRGAVGAGTGLGKSLLIYDDATHLYHPHPSEGGHADLPLYNEKEFTLIKGLQLGHPPSYEEILSGRGLERLYRYFQRSAFPQEADNLSSQSISKNRHASPCCKLTFEWFVRFYARCARNFAIETLAKGGMYLAGGIAAKNHDMFPDVFMKEFTRHPLPQYQELLQKIPVHLITNYDISLKGAALASIAKRQGDPCNFLDRSR